MVLNTKIIDLFNNLEELHTSGDESAICSYNRVMNMLSRDYKQIDISLNLIVWDILRRVGRGEKIL